MFVSKEKLRLISACFSSDFHDYRDSVPNSTPEDVTSGLEEDFLCFTDFYRQNNSSDKQEYKLQITG